MKGRVVIFLLLFFTGIAFGVWSMVIPPEGVISSSVLIFIAQIFVLCASVYGYELHIDLKAGKVDAGKKIQSDEQE